jgi:hypothetical protein
LLSRKRLKKEDHPVYPHRIRLRGPWDCEPVPLSAATDNGPRTTDEPGRVRFRRRFGYPGRIDDYERVWLTFSGVEGTADVWLNGHFLGRQEQPAGAFEYEVTALLRARNELVVEVEGPAMGGLWGEVAMEVRRTAFLRNAQVRAERSAGALRLHVSGEVVGTAERPLELYVVLGRHPAAYGHAEAAPEGRPFTLSSEEVPAERWPPEPPVVRVDLVDGANVWYTMELAADVQPP